MNVTCVLNIVVLFMLSIFRAVNALFEGFFSPIVILCLHSALFLHYQLNREDLSKTLKKMFLFFFCFFI